MKKINYSIVINQQTEELFSRAYLCTCKGYSVDEDILKPLLCSSFRYKCLSGLYE